MECIWHHVGEEESNPWLKVEHDRHVKASQERVHKATEHVEPAATPRRNVDESRRYGV